MDTDKSRAIHVLSSSVPQSVKILARCANFQRARSPGAAWLSGSKATTEGTEITETTETELGPKTRLQNRSQSRLFALEFSP